MRRSLVVCFMGVFAMACSHQRSGEPVSSPTGFVDRVWTVAESAGGPGDLYIFLSDGTFVRAAKESAPDIGKWGWDGKQISLIWSGLPYTADVDSLTETYFKLTFHLMNRSFDVGLVPATPSMPDTTRTVEFDPTRALVNASGDNPAWLFSVRNDRAMFRSAKYGTLNFTGEWLMEEPHAWEWDGQRSTESGIEKITMHLREEVCRKEPDIELPFTAVLILGDESWRGCAVVGKLPETVRPDSTK